MNKIKRVISMVVILGLVFTAFPLVAAYAAGNFNWEVGETVDEVLDAPFVVGLDYDWSITGGALPAGLSITPAGNASAFRITGSPTTVESGTFDVTYQDTGLANQAFTETYAFDVIAHSCYVTITTAVLSGGETGRTYSAVVLADCCDSPATFALDSGALPPGLTLHGDGTITGVPTQSGTFLFRVSAEVNNQFHNASDEKDYTIHVTAPNPRRNNDSDSGNQQEVYYVIESEAGKGGSISPEGLTRVYDYGNQAYTIKAEDGYVIDRVLVDGKDIGAVGKYEFTRVSADHLIQAYFVKEGEPAPETATYNPVTGAPGAAKGMVSLGAALLLLGGACLLKGKN